MRLNKNQHMLSLEPCPKCGGQAELLTLLHSSRRGIGTRRKRGVQCADCAYTVEGRTVKEAAERWNKPVVVDPANNREERYELA